MCIYMGGSGVDTFVLSCYPSAYVFCIFLLTSKENNIQILYTILTNSKPQASPGPPGSSSWRRWAGSCASSARPNARRSGAPRINY